MELGFRCIRGWVRFADFTHDHRIIWSQRGGGSIDSPEPSWNPPLLSIYPIILTNESCLFSMQNHD